MKFMKLACSFLSAVIIPIVAYTETLIKAKEVPVTANKTLVIAKLPSEGMSKHAPVTRANAVSIAFYSQYG